MFTKKHISTLVHHILFIALVMGLVGLHPARSVLAAGKGRGENVVTVQKGLAITDALPDLIIESITVMPANPATNETVIFSVVVKNQGLANSGAFFVDLFIDEPLPAGCDAIGAVYYDVPGLAAGASTTVTMKHGVGFTTDGLHTINGIVDTNCDVDESREDNNTRVISATSAPAVGPGIYDDSNPAWHYSGTWLTYSGGGPYNNTLHYSSTTGNYAEVTFSGVQIKLTYLKAAVRGSIAVYIDNFVTPVATLNANSSTTTWQSTWTSALLTPGVHTVRFQNAVGGRIDLDAIQVFGAVTGGIYDDSNAAWTYTGAWSTYTGSGPYLNTLHYSSTTGNYAEVRFIGPQIKLTYLKAAARGSIAIYIDNMVTPVTTINTNSATTTWQATWTSSVLSDDVHIVRLQNAGGGRIDLDALQVIAPDTMAPGTINLTATTGAGNGAVNLNWTAVGDDNNTGTATSYLVRYATTPIADETAWNNATIVSSGIPTPKVAGQAESMSVTGLTAGEVYYFAVRAQDEHPNLGALSNSPSAAASAVPAAGPGTYDDMDSAWSYTGTWLTYTGGGPYLNTLHYSSTTGNYAEVTFNSTQVQLKYLKAGGRGSIAIYIDNMVTPVTTINTNSTTTAWQSTWTSPLLTAGNHTIRFQNAGGGRIDLDAVTVIGPDTTAPAAINLAATTGAGNGAVNLNWTAVGDDNNTGTATSYLVRYATTPIADETAWNNATIVSSGIPTPKVAGQAESMSVTGLTAGEVYYFAVRAQDEHPNLGALSNSPSAAASAVPPVGPDTYDDMDSAWSYTGTWLTYTGGGPYLNTLHYSSTTGNYAEVTFEGTQVTLTFLKAAGRGSIAIYIDNMVTPVTTINSNSTTTTWQASWTSAVLDPGVHTIRFKNAGGGRIDLDAITVMP